MCTAHGTSVISVSPGSTVLVVVVLFGTTCSTACSQREHKLVAVQLNTQACTTSYSYSDVQLSCTARSVMTLQWPTAGSMEGVFTEKVHVYVGSYSRLQAALQFEQL
jgi:hypothetical protein